MLTPIYWLTAMFVYGLVCYIVGGWEEHRDHDKWCDR